MKLVLCKNVCKYHYQKEYMKSYTQKNRTKLSAQKRAWAIQNPEKNQLSKTKYTKNNQKTINEVSRSRYWKYRDKE